MNEEKIPCPQCCELISNKAKVCPFCRTPVGKHRYLRNYGLVIFVFAFIGYLYASSSTSYLNREKFSDHKSEIMVISSEMSYIESGSCDGGGRVLTIGTINNMGEIGWDGIKLEVQYFNEAGKLIDTESDTQYGLAILPGESAAFKVSGSAASEKENYSSHKVTIRHASKVW